MRSFVTSDGLTLAFRDEGSGTPVLCLAGLTRNSRDFDHMAKALDEDIRLIRLDYRGRGASEWAEDYNTYSVPVEARDAIELLDYLNIPKAAIIGTSRGGIIAMVLAATSKERLAGVVLNDIGPELIESGLDKIKGYLGKNPSYKTFDEAVASIPEFYAGQFENVSPEMWRELAEAWWNETPDGLEINYDPKLRDAVLESAAGLAPDLWPFFEALEGLPLALIRGANSDLLSQETADKMRDMRPDMTFTNVPDRGHVPFLNEPESLAAIRTMLLKVAP